MKIAITHGDANGVGYEVILKSLADEMILEMITPIIYGSSKVATIYRKMMELPNMQLNIIASADDADDNCVNIINSCDEDLKIEPGVASTETGRAAYDALERAVADLQQGAVDALVTAPIDKKTVQNDTFHFPGHTEYLEMCAGKSESLMILMNDRVRVALVTGHLPLSKVSSAVTKERIEHKAKLFNESLKRDMGVHRPKIAILSLNPHSGDNGLLGSEESSVITPAIEALREQGLLVYGPFASDGFFGAGEYARYDGVLAMYHDQGLAPFKAIAMDNGINFTAGLPFVRTSPDHGTAYDIAGKGIASETSLRHAIYWAIDICRNRDRYDEAIANPLKRQPQSQERSNDRYRGDRSRRES